MGEDKKTNESQAPRPKDRDDEIKDTELNDVAGGLTQERVLPGDGTNNCC